MTRRYDNQGRDLINIENARDVYIAGTRKRPDRELKWLKAFSDEVEGRLATSLHNQILINLGKEAQLDQVRRLWDMEVKTAQATEAIAPETEILTVFDRKDIAGKLLILGKPGAGKTTTLLELARALVKRAIYEPIAPMPFLLSLSSWKDPNQSIRDWAIAELTTKGVGSKIGAKWFAEQKLLPLLDGLDEVRSDLQPACVKAINQFLGGEEQSRSIVVCSRREEYELYPEKLNLNGAVYLQELSNEQIERYLREIDRLTLWQVLSTDTELLELVRDPLWLSFTLVAYRNEFAERWQALRSTQERIKLLLDVYVEKMLHWKIKSKWYTSKKEPTAKQTRQWLVKLAKQLQKESQTEFLIEKMQPNWLIARCYNAYVLIVALIIGMVYGLVFGLVFGIRGGLIVGIVYGLLGGLMAALSDIKPVEKVNLSLNAFFKFTRSQRLIVATAGFLSGMWFGMILEIIYGTVLALIFGAFSGLFLAFTFVLIKSSKAELETHVYPNQGIFNSTKTSLVALTISFIVALVIQVVLYPSFSHIPFNEVAQKGLIILLYSLIWYAFCEHGGQACIQHFSLRLVLFLNRTIPGTMPASSTTPQSACSSSPSAVATASFTNFCKTTSLR
ncbi:MAG: hypothetical protein C4288_01770 [Leptolyngbya sp. ERB_1_1]